ncbi:MAG TPA: hypothetical protein PKA37_16825, partial [Planctomycetota bacterium]|nr:hypothetical protein [Planctomycetota bacterium]
MTAPDLRAEPLPAGPVRPASIHIPYVVTAALFALANGVWFHIPGGHPAHLVMIGIAGVAFPLHVAWLARIYRDAREILADTVAMGERRMRVLTVLTAPVYCIWAPFALRLVFRAAHIRAAERELAVAVRFAQLEEFALSLQRGGFLALMVYPAVSLKMGAA